MAVFAAHMGVAVPVLGDGGDIDAGREIYDENCASCHGYDGIPLLPMSPNFAKAERMEKDDAELLRSITAGKGDMMPPWEDILNEQERLDVLGYVRSMGESATDDE